MNTAAPTPSDESPLVGWLSGAGLLHLAPLLRAHAIDVDVLGSLSEADMAHIGLPLGDRKRLLQAWAQAPWQPPADAEGQRRQLTIVFADLVDSTVWCQALSPEAWRELVLGFSARPWTCCSAMAVSWRSTSAMACWPISATRRRVKTPPRGPCTLAWRWLRPWGACPCRRPWTGETGWACAWASKPAWW